MHDRCRVREEEDKEVDGKSNMGIGGVKSRKDVKDEKNKKKAKKRTVMQVEASAHATRALDPEPSAVSLPCSRDGLLRKMKDADDEPHQTKIREKTVAHSEAVRTRRRFTCEKRLTAMACIFFFFLFSFFFFFFPSCRRFR